MALQENVAGGISLPASADLSTKQYLAVKVNASGKLAVASTGEFAIGILQDKPSADGTIGNVLPFGGRKMKAVAGGTVTAGDLLKVDSAGKLQTAEKSIVDTSDTSATDPVQGSAVVGVALEDAVIADIFQFLGFASGAVATTAA